MTIYTWARNGKKSQTFLKALGLALSLSGLHGCLNQEHRVLASAEHHVASQLLDPDSARFSGGYVVFRPEANGYRHGKVCGYVSANNSFGGYAPKARYTVTVIVGNGVQDISNVQIEPPDYLATAESSETDQPETIFEAVYWNVGWR